MEYHQDWLMRQIQQLVQTLCRVLLGEDIRLEQSQSQKWRTLQSLLEKRGICPAEDYLLEQMEPGDPEWLEAGLRFYDRLNGMSDEELARQNFSREEIREGLERISWMDPGFH